MGLLQPSPMTVARQGICVVSQMNFPVCDEAGMSWRFTYHARWELGGQGADVLRVDGREQERDKEQEGAHC